MEKIIILQKIDGTEEEVLFKCTALVPLRYQSIFRRNFLKDLVSLATSLQNTKIDIKAVEENLQKSQEAEDIEINEDTLSIIGNIDIEILYKIIYVLAKTADPKILPFENWIDQYESIDIMEAIEFIPFILNTIIPEKKTLNRKKNP